MSDFDLPEEEKKRILDGFKNTVSSPTCRCQIKSDCCNNTRSETQVNDASPLQVDGVVKETPDCLEVGAIGKLRLTWLKCFYGDGSDKEWLEVGDAIREVLEALSTIKAKEVEWQPIETAPKDGTRFLAWVNGAKEPFICNWDWNGFDKEKGWFSVYDRDDEVWGFKWQPLPTPPKDTT